MTTIEAHVSSEFRRQFEEHPLRHTDPAMALESAREDASKLVPAGVYGSFDDETLTFRVETAPECSICRSRHGREIEHACE